MIIYILAHDGDEGIGGVLFDKILFDYVMNYCKQQYGKSPLPDEDGSERCLYIQWVMGRKRVKMVILYYWINILSILMN